VTGMYLQELMYSIEVGIIFFFFLIMHIIIKQHRYYIYNKYISLTNRGRGPNCELRTKFFPFDLWPARFADSYYIRYITDREDEVSKIFIISLMCV